MDNLVTADWLKEKLGDTDLVVLDCSVSIFENPDGTTGYESGRSDYERGHIPTAGFADLMGTLSNRNSTMQFALPTPNAFCQEMRNLGISDDTLVVLYDSSFTAWAARVWWMLRWVGFDNAAILDGGRVAWISAENSLSMALSKARPGQLSLNLRPEVIANQREIKASLSSSDVCLIDTLPAESFRGDASAYARPGHIVGASHQFTLDLFDENGFFKPDEQPAVTQGRDLSKRQIVYCGAGILASASAFRMFRSGYRDVAVYVASLQEWALDPNNPMTTEVLDG